MQPLTRPAISASVSGREHHERVLDAPVGGVGHVRDARQAVELDVVLGRVGGAARAASGGAVRPSRESWRRKPARRAAAACSSSPTRRVALRVGVGRAALAHLGQAVVQGIDQQAAALGVVQQVVLQVGIALHHPDVAQHLVQHAGRAAGAALLAQPVQHLPGARAQQPDHDLAVGERGVVVGNLAQARRIAIDGGHELVDGVWVRSSGSGAEAA